MINIFKRSKKQNEVETRSNYGICNCYGDGLNYPIFSSQWSALNLSVAFRCVSLISQTLASMPFEVKNKDGEVVKEHPVAYIFNNKTDNLLTKYDMIKMVVTNVLLNGNGYLYLERGADGTVIGFRYLQAGDVTVEYRKEINTLRYRCNYINKGNFIDRKDILHFKLYSYNGVEGISVLNYASRSIKNGNLIEDAVTNYYKNGTLLSGILSYQGNLSSDQREQIRNSWNSVHGGNSGGVAVLGGGLTFENLSSNAQDAALNESREYSVNDIARFFGVPAILLGVNNGINFSTFESVEQLFLVNCLQPIMEMVEQELNRKIFMDSDFYIDIDESNILRCDKRTSSHYFSTLVDKGILTRNEARNEMGFQSVEGGDDLTVSYTDVSQNTFGNDQAQKGETNEEK